MRNSGDRGGPPRRSGGVPGKPDGRQGRGGSGRPGHGPGKPGGEDRRDQGTSGRRGQPGRESDGRGRGSPRPSTRFTGDEERSRPSSRSRGNETGTRPVSRPEQDPRPKTQPKPQVPGHFRLLIACAIGVERALGNELKHLGFSILDSGSGRYEIDASLDDIYKALRCLRTAERVMAVLVEDQVRDFDGLFQIIEAVSWETWLPEDARVHIDKVRVHDSPLRSVPDIQAIAQKAIYTRLGKAYKLRKLPETGAEFKVRLYVERDRVRLCLDLSGDALHKRGWRTESGVAPIKETIAAAMIILSGWKRRHPFHDPFCGSGTFAIEALSFAFDLPPNLDRAIGMTHTKLHDARRDTALQKSVLEKLKLDHVVRISGSDSDKYMVDLARANLERMIEGLGLGPEHSEKLRSCVQFNQSPMQSLNSGQLDLDGFFVCNPPYGERIGDLEHARQTYGHMRHLRRTFPTWRLSTVTSWDKFDEDLEEKAAWIRPLRNGVSDAFIYFFEASEPQVDPAKSRT